MNRSDPDDTKQRLRRRFRARRNALDNQQARRASRRVCRRLADSSLMQSVPAVAAYMAKGHEIDLQEYVDGALDGDVEILLPRVTGPGEMEFCRFDDWNQLEVGSFDIYEPTGPAVTTDHVEVFLVPGLAFDAQGNRLGFGMGYYDRALPERGRATAIGVCHHWQFVDELPAEEHDRPMDVVVTDDGWHQLGADDHDSRE